MFVFPSFVLFLVVVVFGVIVAVFPLPFLYVGVNLLYLFTVVVSLSEKKVVIEVQRENAKLSRIKRKCAYEKKREKGSKRKGEKGNVKEKNVFGFQATFLYIDFNQFS